MVKYGELDQALETYVCVDTHETIPAEYYRRVIMATIKANNDGKQWDMKQAAAILLYFVFNDNVLSPSQLTADGLKALDYAEIFLQKNDITIEPVKTKDRHSA